MMKRVSILFTLLLLMIFSLSAQEIAPVKGSKTITFTFAPGKDTFILQGNEAELTRLYQLVDEYRNEISSGRRFWVHSAFCILGSIPCLYK